MEDDITVLIPVVFRIFFNSHPHMEDDGISQMWWIKHNLFNSHPHKEDDALVD